LFISVEDFLGQICDLERQDRNMDSSLQDPGALALAPLEILEEAPVNLYILLAGGLQFIDKPFFVQCPGVSLEDRKTSSKWLPHFVERLRLVERRSRTVASCIKRVYASRGGPHVVTDLDAVIIVPQHVVDRAAQVVKQPHSVNPDKKKDQQRRKQPESQ